MIYLSPYGLSPFGYSPYGPPPGPFGLQGATSLMPVVVQVIFNDILDLTNPDLLVPSNYVLSPAIAVHSVNIETAGSVRLTTDYLNAPVFTVTVTGPTSFTGRSIDPALQTVTFDGFPVIKGFSPVGVSKRKVRVLFEDYMEVNAALTDPASYVVISPHGDVLPVISVIAEGLPSAPVAVALVLDADLVPRGVHTVIIAPGVHTHFGFSVLPNTKNFRWVPRVPNVSVLMSEFVGETREGLLGQHGGLVFFSPALSLPAPNSAIQVEEVSVCTRAHDIYQIPNPPDPTVLFIFKPGISAGTLATPERVTFANFDRLGGAHLALGDLRQETIPPPVDSHCLGTMVETLDPSRAPRLNAVHYTHSPPRTAVWPIFDGISSTPFTMALNLTPIPPGSTTGIIFQP